MKQYVVTVVVSLGYGEAAFRCEVFNTQAEATKFIELAKRLTPEATITIERK